MSQPSTQDLQPPFDPTGFASINGAQLLQLITGAYPNTDTGFILVSTDAAGNVPNVPAANTTTKWQNYMWLRISSTYVTAYVWNTNGATDPTYLNWVTLSSASIGAGVIQGYQIANNTIPSTAIITLSSAQITGSVVAAWIAQLNLAQTAYSTNGLVNNYSPVFGVLNGAGSTVTEPVFGSSVIPSTAFTPQTIAGTTAATTSPITDNSITTRQLANNGGSVSTAQTVAAVDPLANIMVPTTSIIGIPSNTPSTQGVSAGDVLAVSYNATASKVGFVTTARSILGVEPALQTYSQIPFVAPNGVATTYVNPQGANSGNPLGRILQRIDVMDISTLSTNLTCAYNVTPSLSAVANVLATGLIQAITPISSASTIIVEVVLFLANSTTNVVIGALFTGASTPWTLVAAASSYVTASNEPCNVTFRYKVTPGSLSPITFTVAYSGSSNGSSITYYNRTAGSSSPYGGVVNSFMTITEYL